MIGAGASGFQIAPAIADDVSHLTVFQRTPPWLLPVETYDERLTTVTAQRSLREMNVSPAARTRAIDQIAAAVMLQAWLDHRRENDTDEVK